MVVSHYRNTSIFELPAYFKAFSYYIVFSKCILLQTYPARPVQKFGKCYCRSKLNDGSGGRPLRRTSGTGSGCSTRKIWSERRQRLALEEFDGCLFVYRMW